MAHVAEFRLSITQALADQLTATLDRLNPEPLSPEAIREVDNRPGVYVLYRNRQRVYVGKAAELLRDRLMDHHKKISGRSGISVSEMTFVCSYVDEDLDAAAPEKLLIKKYRSSEKLPWNANGFGNKDPGRRRDKSLVRAKHFDAQYPIDLDRVVEVDPPRGDVESILRVAKARAPYLIRYTSDARDLDILRGVTVDLGSREISIRDLIGNIIRALPMGWQATALPGYLILYPETTRYSSALLMWRKDPSGNLDEIRGDLQFSEGAIEDGDGGE